MIYYTAFTKGTQHLVFINSVMSKKSLHEIAQGNEAIKSSRSEPIQREEPRRQTMDFIRSLVLDIPIQTVRDQPVREEMNIERMLEAQLDAEAKKLEAPKDETDYVSFDIPLLIRVLEHAREGIDSDVDLHDLVERIISIRSKGVLTMDDYDLISGGDIEGTDMEHAPKSIASDRQDESLAALRKLAGI